MTMTHRDDIITDRRGDLGGPLSRDGLELREAVAGEYTDIDTKNHRVQVTFPHETVDSFRTVFGPNAFKDSFAKRLPAMCWQHDVRNPIGRAISAKAGTRSNEIVGQFSDFDAVPDAKRAFSQIADGTLTDMSFGFKGARYEPAPSLGKGVRRIVSAHMAEFSPVTIGSIPGAVVTGFRSDGTPIWSDTRSTPVTRGGSGAGVGTAYRGTGMAPGTWTGDGFGVPPSGGAQPSAQGNDPTFWQNSLGNPMDRGALQWQKLSEDGSAQTAIGPMGHQCAVWDDGDSCSWVLTDPLGRQMAQGSHPWRRGAKAEVAKRCPGATS